MTRLVFYALPAYHFKMKHYYVYIISSHTRTIYTGVTNNLQRRIFQHKEKTFKGFSAKYNIHRLVYFEVFSNIRDAIRREKEIKGWVRRKKVALIEEENPHWDDLTANWE